MTIDRIKHVYSKMKKKIATVFIEILKQKRKFLIVKKGTRFQDSLLKTYVIVEMFGINDYSVD